jgi:DNA-directed RNA polymerase subunit delta
MRVADAAYEVLRQHGQPMDVQDLLDETLARLGHDREPRKAAQIYTEINLDPRFQHREGTMWGLTEWQPRGSSQRGGVLPREVVADPGDGRDEELSDEDEWA